MKTSSALTTLNFCQVDIKLVNTLIKQFKYRLKRIYVSACVSVCHVFGCPWGPAQRNGSPQASQPEVGAGNQTSILLLHSEFRGQLGYTLPILKLGILVFYLWDRRILAGFPLNILTMRAVSSLLSSHHMKTASVLVINVFFPMYPMIQHTICKYCFVFFTFPLF